MPVRRINYPDYFGTSSRAFDVYADDHNDDLTNDYAVQPVYEAQQASFPARNPVRPNQWALSNPSATTPRGLDNLRQFAYGGDAGTPGLASHTRQPAQPRVSNAYGMSTSRRQPAARRAPAARAPRGRQAPKRASNVARGRIDWSLNPDGTTIPGMEQYAYAEEEYDQEEPAPVGMGRGAGRYQPARPTPARRAHMQGPTYDTRDGLQDYTTPSARRINYAYADNVGHPMPLPTPRYSSPSPLTRATPAFAPRAPPRLSIGPRPAGRPSIQPVYRTAPSVHGIELISPSSALDVAHRPIFPYDHFNAMQSSCLSAVYGSSDNVVVAAPTGSGKTCIFELAVCRLLAQREREQRDWKIVYQAPTKALCAERTRDWQTKFARIDSKLQVAEFTGDSSALDVRRVRTASIIITTPEKWDSITRKWSHNDSNSALLKSIKLVLIDEVHILKDSRGATLETVVSRMKTLGSEVRFVTVSATIPNSSDIAQWLGRTHTMPDTPARIFVFGEEFRPVRLQKIVLGFNAGSGGGSGPGGSEHSLDNILDDQLPNLLAKHARGKPVLIFCFSRKSTESAAAVLADFWTTCPPSQRPWPAPTLSMGSSTAKLQTTLEAGVAFHHGGLERQDRNMIESAFLEGHISVVCCTSTLAVGVNLPCHTVILKGTVGYQNGKFAEYDEFELMQMIGRAGRPQFDTSATAIILTKAENREKYLNLESGRQTVESTLHLNLIEHLNSEIVLGTITSLATAVRWLRGTFLAVRLARNPNHYYQLTDGATAKPTDERLEEICRTGIARLAEVGLLKYLRNAEDGVERGRDDQFHGTEYGSAMSTYMVRFETMVEILKFDKTLSLGQLINSMCRASEFDEIRIKTTERTILRELNKSEDNNIPFPLTDTITETWQKVSILLQVEMSRGTLPHQSGRFVFEARHAIELMQRLLEAYVACMTADGNGHNTRIGLELARSIQARAWEGDQHPAHPAQLCQVPDIGPVNMRKLADRGVTTVRQFAELSCVMVENFLSKNPPAAMKIVSALKSFPRLVIVGGCVSRSGDSDRAVATVTVAFDTPDGLPPKWRGRVPPLSFVAETAGDGVLLHIWRGRLQANRVQYEACFAVPAARADEVCCYVACDEVVGTQASAQLSVLDVPMVELRALLRGVKARPVPSVQTLKRQAGASKNKEAPETTETPETPAPNTKRQKTRHTPSVAGSFGSGTRPTLQSSTGTSPGGSLVSCRSGPSDLIGSLSFSSLPTSGHATAALSSTKTPFKGSGKGGGTANNPFTLDSDSDDDSDAKYDDFDADLFDDLDLLEIEATANASSTVPPASLALSGVHEAGFIDLSGIEEETTITAASAAAKTPVARRRPGLLLSQTQESLPSLSPSPIPALPPLSRAKGKGKEKPNAKDQESDKKSKKKKVQSTKGKTERKAKEKMSDAKPKKDSENDEKAKGTPLKSQPKFIKPSDILGSDWNQDDDDDLSTMKSRSPKLVGAAVKAKERDGEAAASVEAASAEEDTAVPASPGCEVALWDTSAGQIGGDVIDDEDVTFLAFDDEVQEETGAEEEVKDEGGNGTGTEPEAGLVCPNEQRSQAAPDEPSWVAEASDSSIIDFLRGHVKFV